MFIKIVTGRFIQNKIYNVIFTINLICILIILFQNYTPHSFQSLLLILSLSLIGIIFYKKNNALANLTIFQSTFFIIIPLTLTFLFNHNFSSQIEMPYENYYYYNDLCNSIFFLTFCYIFLFTGIYFADKNKQNKINNYVPSFEFRKLLIIAPFVFIFEIFSIFKANENFINRFDSNYIYQKVNFLEILLNPISFIIICICTIHQSKKLQHQYLIYFLMFTFFINSLISGSRSSLISIFVYFYLIPAFINPRFKFRIIIDIKFITLLLITLFIIFHVNSFLRSENYRFYDLYDLNKLTNIFISFSNFESSIFNAFSRLSASFNSFIALYYQFGNNLIDLNYKFAEYLLKSTINLLLPGVIFPEAYLTTSIIYLDVLKNNELNGFNNDNIWLLINTQSYLFFGVLTIIFGKLPALIFLLFFGYIFSKIFDYFNNYIFKYVIALSFLLILGSHGLDTAFQTIFLIIISIIFYYLIHKINLKF